jgi:hypothetical protein
MANSLLFQGASKKPGIAAGLLTFPMNHLREFSEV